MFFNEKKSIPKKVGRVSLSGSCVAVQAIEGHLEGSVFVRFSRWRKWIRGRETDSKRRRGDSAAVDCQTPTHSEHVGIEGMVFVGTVFLMWDLFKGKSVGSAYRQIVR